MDKFSKKNNRVIKIIMIVGIAVFLAIVGFLIFSFLSPENADNILSNMPYKYIFGGVIILTIFLVIYGVIINKKYRQELISTKSKNICKYLDTFYYHVKNGPEHILTFEMYHVIKDLSNSRIYVIPKETLNLSNIKDDITKKSFEGTKINFWIDEEMNNCYERDGNNVTICEQKLIYTRESEDRSYSFNEIPKLHNVNKKYDISLLDKATFAYGYAEFVDEKIEQ